jgi:hypothetical protein
LVGADPAVEKIDTTEAEESVVAAASLEVIVSVMPDQDVAGGVADQGVGLASSDRILEGGNRVCDPALVEFAHAQVNNEWPEARQEWPQAVMPLPTVIGVGLAQGETQEIVPAS